MKRRRATQSQTGQAKPTLVKDRDIHRLWNLNIKTVGMLIIVVTVLYKHYSFTIV